MEGTKLTHSASDAGRAGLHALARQLYALISSGDDGLAFSVGAGGPMLIERGAGGAVRLLQLVYEDSAAKWYRAKELRDGVERDRRFNPWVLWKHLQGRYSVAPAANGWVSWACIDIDAHKRSGETELDARRRAKAVLGEVWRALGCSATRHPPLFRSPGGGYHLYLPLTRGAASANAEHTWPARVVRAWLEWHLVQAGLELGLGDIEVYPSGRSLRAPCGRGMVLLQAGQPENPSALGLTPWPGTATGSLNWRAFEAEHQQGVEAELTSWSRLVAPTARAFIAQFEAQRRTLADWLGRPEAAWDPRWGFLGWRDDGAGIPRWGEIFAGEKNSDTPPGGEDSGSQQSDDVPGGPMAGGARVAGRKGRDGRAQPERSRGRRKAASSNNPTLTTPSAEGVGSAEVPAGGKLVRGRAFMEKVGRLLLEGVTQVAGRYDAVLTLTFYWGATCGLSTEETLGRLEDWCFAFAHEGSRLACRPRAFLDACVREARHYLEHRGPRWPFRARGGHGGGLGTLRPADQTVVAAVDPRVAGEVATLLAWLAGRADKRGCVAEPVQVSHGLLERLCGDRRIDIDGDGTRHRAATVALTELERIGVLTLARQYVVGRHGRVWSCWYRFGSGELPRAVALPVAKWNELAPYCATPLVPTPAQLEVVPSVPVGAPSAPVVEVMVLGECAAPEGQGLLRALSAGVRGLARTLFSAAPEIGRPTAAPAPRAPWFERHFQMRPMTPGRLWANASMVLAERRRLSRAERLVLGGGVVAAGTPSDSGAAGAPAAAAATGARTVVPIVSSAAPNHVAASASSGSGIRAPLAGTASDPLTLRPAPVPSSLVSRDSSLADTPDSGGDVQPVVAVVAGEPSAPGSVSEATLRAELAELTDPAFAAACDAELLESVCGALRSFLGRERGRGS